MDLKITRVDPSRLAPTPADSELGFGRHFTDHMFMVDYEPTRGWYDARIVPREPLSLDQLSEGLMVSKGSISTNVRALERWGMVEKVWIKANRKDYYRAETRFMDIVVKILQEREKREFDGALQTVSECLEAVKGMPVSEETKFLKRRLTNMQRFF